MMIGRNFIALSTGFVAMAPLRGIAQTGHDPLAYKPGILAEYLGRGATVLLNFRASWCATSATQTRVLNKVKAENAAYIQNITFVEADWDTYGRAQFATRMGIPRRATLVVLKGDDELGRLVAETRAEKIRDLMATALAAARTG